ncbi:hypothetical protein [Thalassospira sp.]|uniref:hypothetical protein n=1 Tax=Thalassospira sp. TaxID=1912094 RepID=UPI0025D12E34|nr:hypothetical protein [Thalassospira sp.]|tara:strand:+ start:805 stop:969 length:165 start_codon:yes stop_codon:yes gene_type:complete
MRLHTRHQRGGNGFLATFASFFLMACDAFENDESDDEKTKQEEVVPQHGLRDFE